MAADSLPKYPFRGVAKVTQDRWAWSNCGFIRGVERTRSDAIKAAEEASGAPWSEASKYMEVWKCRVIPRKP